MKKRKKLSALLLVMLLILTTAGSVAGHPGRTDKNGGHKDNKNASGLGSYHYHCGGNPPHLHDGGGCPYGSGSSNSSSGSSSGSGSSGGNSSSEGSSAASAPVQQKDQITVTGAPEVIQVGQSCPIEVRINAEAESNYTLTSNNEAVVKIVDNTLTAVGAGAAEITVTTSNNTETFILTVQAVPVTAIELEQERITLQIGETQQLNPVIQPENATNKEVSYQSSDEKIVTVSETGMLEGKMAGEAVIVITAADEVTKELIVKITEKEITSIKIDDSKMNYHLEDGDIDINEQWDLRVIVEPGDAPTDQIIWESSDELVVEIKDNEPIPVSTGKVTLTVKAPSGMKDMIKLNVIDRTETEGATSIIAGILAFLCMCIPLVLIVLGSVFLWKHHQKKKRTTK